MAPKPIAETSSPPILRVEDDMTRKLIVLGVLEWPTFIDIV